MGPARRAGNDAEYRVGGPNDAEYRVLIFDSEGKGRMKRAGPSTPWVTGVEAKARDTASQSQRGVGSACNEV